MRIIFVVGGFHTGASGVARIVAAQANALGRGGSPVDVYTVVCRGQELADDLVAEPTRCIGAEGQSMFRLARSPKLKQMLRNVMHEVDIVHCQSLWMLPTAYASDAAYHGGQPVIFTAHGFLEPWALQHSGWKKAIVARLFQDRNLRRAACIHVNSERELESVRQYGLINPVAIIPNGVDAHEFETLPAREVAERAYPALRGKKVALFMSRLHRKKGVEHLLRAWANVTCEYEEWHLVIAGPDDGYEKLARSYVEEKRLGSTVTFTGHVEGQARLALLAAAELFVLPSFSEGFSMAILEAMACALPVAITHECNFPEVEKAGVGVIGEPSAKGAEEGLRELMGMEQSEREKMGKSAKAFVSENYTWDNVAIQLTELYRWVKGDGARPASVHTV